MDRESPAATSRLRPVTEPVVLAPVIATWVLTTSLPFLKMENVYVPDPGAALNLTCNSVMVAACGIIPDDVFDKVEANATPTPPS